MPRFEMQYQPLFALESALNRNDFFHDRPEDLFVISDINEPTEFLTTNVEALWMDLGGEG